jgi:hypothetical protein
MHFGILTSIIFGAILVQLAVLVWVGMSRRGRESKEWKAGREKPET